MPQVPILIASAQNEKSHAVPVVMGAGVPAQPTFGKWPVLVGMWARTVGICVCARARMRSYWIQKPGFWNIHTKLLMLENKVIVSWIKQQRGNYKEFFDTKKELLGVV